MFELSIEEFEEMFKEEETKQPEEKKHIQTDNFEDYEGYTENYGSTSLKIVGLNSYRYNKRLMISTDMKKYNEYKTTKKIKNTLLNILNNTNIE